MLSRASRARELSSASACPHCHAAKPCAGRHPEQEGAEKREKHERAHPLSPPRPPDASKSGAAPRLLLPRAHPRDSVAPDPSPLSASAGDTQVPYRVEAGGGSGAPNRGGTG